MVIRILWIAVVVMGFGACKNARDQHVSGAANPVVGAWRGGPMHMSTGDSSWIAPYATGEQVIVFASTGPGSGYYCRMGMSKERKDPFTGAMADPRQWDKVAPNEWLEAKSYLYDTFTANCGPYSVSTDTIRRVFEFEKNQAIAGASPVWEFQLIADTMKTIARDPWWVDTTKTVTTTIVWTRMK